jgi:hypothetical protein
MGDEDIMIRMTGCPNGCGRPYMAELGYVGDGRDTYQLWVGGSPTLDGRTGFALLDRVKDKNMEETLAALFAYWRESRTAGEKFGNFTHRMGKEDLLAFIDGYTVTEEDLKDPEMYDEDAESESDVSITEITPIVTQDQLKEEMAAAKRPAGPEATKAAMEAMILADKEVAKETTLGMVTRIGTRPEVSEEKPAEKPADETKAEGNAAAAKEEPKAPVETKDQATAQAAALAAAQAAAQISEEEVAAELKAKATVEAGAGLMAAHKSADEERLRKKEEAAKVVEKPEVAEEKSATIKVKVESKKPAKIHAGEGLIREVFAYRVFKKNPQWCVEWTGDSAVSWESWDKLDSDELREKALELQKSVA